MRGRRGVGGQLQYGHYGFFCSYDLGTTVVVAFSLGKRDRRRGGWRRGSHW